MTRREKRAVLSDGLPTSPTPPEGDPGGAARRGARGGGAGGGSSPPPELGVRSRSLVRFR